MKSVRLWFARNKSDLIKDGAFLLGLGLLGYGLWLVWPPLAYTVVGGFFLALWMIAFLKAAKGG